MLFTVIKTSEAAKKCLLVSTLVINELQTCFQSAFKTRKHLKKIHNVLLQYVLGFQELSAKCHGLHQLSLLCFDGGGDDDIDQLTEVLVDNS